MLKNYFARHLQAGLNSLGQFTRSPFASFMICLVIGITLALPTALFVGIKNIDSARGNFQQTTQLTLYLKNNITEKQADSLVKNILDHNGVAKAYTISPQEGLAELQQQAGFQDIDKELQNNPLPWTIVVVPTLAYDTADSLDKLQKSLKQLPDVETAQLDMLWVKRLEMIISVAKRIVLALSILLATAVLLIINNSIRSATQNNHKEIEVIKLIGGTNSFIRRPFLYAGVLYGLLGGIIAWQLVDVLLIAIRSPLHHLAKLYNNAFDIIGLGFTETFTLLSVSILLGLIGSWLAVTRHLRSY